MRLVKELLLLLLAIPVFLIPAVIGVIYTFIKHVRRWDYNINKQLAPIVRSLSLSLDGFANAAAGELLNDLIVEDNTNHRYGKWNETISAVTGWNAKKDTLSKFGKRFREFVDRAFNLMGEKGSHVINAIKDPNK